MKNYAKAIVTGAFLVAGNMAYAAEPVALNAQDLDLVSAGTAATVFSSNFQAGHAGNALTAIAFGGPQASAGVLNGAATGNSSVYALSGGTAGATATGSSWIPAVAGSSSVTNASFVSSGSTLVVLPFVR
jgi:hypothetical protein